MNRKVSAAIIIVLILGAFAALAQTPSARPPRGAALVHYLELSAEQRAAWEGAHKEFVEAAKPLAAKERELKAQLRTALQGGDATTVGTLTLQIRATAEQIRAAREAMEVKLVSVLTPDQKTKFDAFKAAAQSMRRGRHAAKP